MENPMDDLSSLGDSGNKLDAVHGDMSADGRPSRFPFSPRALLIQTVLGLWGSWRGGGSNGAFRTWVDCVLTCLRMAVGSVMMGGADGPRVGSLERRRVLAAASSLNNAAMSGRSRFDSCRKWAGPSRDSWRTGGGGGGPSLPK